MGLEGNPVEGSPIEDAPRSVLDTLVENAMSRFRSQETYLHEGKSSPYLSVTATTDAIRALNRPPIELFATLAAETKFRPADLATLSDVEYSQETWGQFITTVCEDIVYMELDVRYPEIPTEDDRRSTLYGPQHYQ